MALAIDGSAPANVTTINLAVTSASFTPPARSMIVAVCSVGNSTGAGATSGAITDSISSTGWRMLDRFTITGGSGSCEIWAMDAGDSPAARTVTLTGSGANGKGLILDTYVFTGSARRDELIGAKGGAGPVAGAGATVSVTLTTVFDQSYVVFAVQDDQQTTLGYTAAANCTLRTSFPDSNGEAEGTGRSTNLLSVGSFTAGLVSASTAVNATIGAWEIKADMAVTARGENMGSGRRI